MSEKLEKDSRGKTYARELSTALTIFLCWLTYLGKTEVSDWVTPMTVFLTVSFGAKQEALQEMVKGRK